MEKWFFLPYFALVTSITTMKKALIGILCLWNGVAWAQETHPWEEVLVEMGIVDEENEGSLADMYDLLSELAEHPIDLNKATREDLEQLPFLTDEQVEEICEYLYRYGPMKSLGELAMIESLGYAERQLLMQFVVVEVFQGNKGELKGHYQDSLATKGYRPFNSPSTPFPFPSSPTITPLPSHLSSELIMNARIPLYQRAGDHEGYIGYPYKHSFRYAIRWGKNIKAGLIGAQDAGEPFFANKNKWGYDFYSFYAQVKNWGRLKSVVIGRYRVNMGMGLVINGAFTMGKHNTLATIHRTASIIRPHSSQIEGSYLQGAAATVCLSPHLDVSAFISYRPIDATLNSDSTTISTIVKTGYHRTKTEIGKKHNASEGMAGGHIGYRNRAFHVGVIGVYDWLDRELVPKTNQAYRQYDAAGKRFWNTSVEYGITLKRLSFNGETATGDSHALATINALNWKAFAGFTLQAVQRFYSYRYYALHGNSFSEGGSVQNESGIYIGADWHPHGRLQLRAYSDIAYFPWARYQAHTSSHSIDHSFSATYRWGAFTTFARYRLRMREKDNDDKTALIYNKEHKARVSLSFADTPWTFKTIGDVAYTHYKNMSLGWMVSEEISYRMKQTQVHTTMGYFHTNDYNSRIYTYERGPLYSFTSILFYGKGIHGSLLVRHDFNAHWMVIAKMGYTRYFDRDTIGTALQAIAHQWKADIDLQCRWKF